MLTHHCPLTNFQQAGHFILYIYIYTNVSQVTYAEAFRTKQNQEGSKDETEGS